MGVFCGSSVQSQHLKCSLNLVSQCSGLPHWPSNPSCYSIRQSNFPSEAIALPAMMGMLTFFSRHHSSSCSASSLCILLSSLQALLEPYVLWLPSWDLVTPTSYLKTKVEYYFLVKWGRGSHSQCCQLCCLSSNGIKNCRWNITFCFKLHLLRSLQLINMSQMGIKLGDNPRDRHF